MSRTCGDCGESFGTLTALRVHERDDCVARTNYGRIDPEAGDAGEQAGTELLRCRDCGKVNPDANYDQTTSWADGDAHYIVEFQCRFCGFDNENRLVMEGVDKEELDGLPEHLQPAESEVGQ